MKRLNLKLHEEDTEMYTPFIVFLMFIKHVMLEISYRSTFT